MHSTSPWFSRLKNTAENISGDESENRYMQKVERITADVVVAERLKKWIIDNDLKPGDRLPTEQQLSEELGVARHTIREGIKRLSQLSIVESRTGAGLFMSEISFNNFAEYMQFLLHTNYISMSDLSGVRICLECNVVELAALSADDEHIKMLSDVLEEMSVLVTDPSRFDEYVKADISYHIILADATGNHLLKGIISALKAVLFERMSALSVETIEDSYKTHIEIFDAVKAHDPERAVKLMREHLEIFI